MRQGLLAGVLAGAVLSVAGAASAAPAPEPARPLVVSSSSFTQRAQTVTWTATMRSAVDPASMVSHGRTLCLLLEHRSGVAIEQICVIGPRRGSTRPRVTYASIRDGKVQRAKVFDATVTRGSSRSFTATFLPAAAGLAYRTVAWQVQTTVSASTCAPGAGTPPTCSLRFPRKPVVAKLHTPRLVGCAVAGPDFVYHGPTNQRVVALTFDDGPWTLTSQFLDVLEREHVNATFFELGSQIDTWGQHGAVERRMLADGDMIGDHTWDHANVSGGGSFAASEITRAAAAIRGATGFQPCLFRAPYGAVSSSLIAEARSLGFTTIQWDVDPRDWSRPGTDAIYNTVVGNAHDGAIVIQHDGGGDRSETLAALPREIDTLKREGYRFETVTEMLGLRLIYK